MAKVTPLGYPHSGAGRVEILLENEDGANFSLLFSPDPNNILLRESGQAMQFYYYPKEPRLAKEPGKDGKFKFSMQVFKSEGDSSTVIGAEGLEEEAGAYTSLTTTIDVPEALLKKAIDKLKTHLHKEYQNNRESKLLGLFSYKKGVDRDFDETNVRPIQLVENNISMHVVGEKSPNNPFGGANPWTFNIQGEGAGTTFGLGENAFSILMGRNSASIVKDALQNGTNNLVVENRIKYKAYLPTTIIKTTVNAKRVHTYFSAKASVGWSGVNLDWESEYEKIITDGGIVSEIITDNQFTNEERKQFEHELITKQREFAFQLLQKEIFDKPEKEFTPAKDAERPSSFWRILFGGASVGVSLKHGKQIRQVNFTDEIKFSAIEVMDSKISGNLTPLTSKSGAAAKEDLKNYITEVRLDEDFQKVQVIASLNGGLIKLDKEGDILNDSPVSQVSIEVGYPDSKGNTVWKSSGRMIAPEGSPYVKTTSKSGKEIDAIFPATWVDKSKEKNAFVFDFVKNSTPSKIKVRQNVMYEKDKRIKLKDTVNEYEFDGTKVFIPLPIQNMINYTLSTEQLLQCDTLEVTLKVDKMSTKKFKFTSENFEDLIPYRSWYEMDYTIKPTKYKIKYTCKGKIGSKSKKVSVSTNYIELDYQEGDVLFEIPSGTDAQNKDIEKIRAAFLDE
ncbi:hypothetical protein SY27_11855 [Flavobacterium sp. 316]|uniref:Thiol-activated cytolysin n=1 Tax=Flavobacterium sediminilitoris TaxID=2024526 RepID=A0ABY4HQB2_9FLAO|nr:MULTISPECIES: hypothetical protein [Flavobacterium]KIX20596.1 hypothetical protein SY27_11855 [Flavobacterium sp. 316]UOX34821.1 hypothetical protein LXD69_04755 [Flavobacterium sediminilitoris]